MQFQHEQAPMLLKTLAVRYAYQRDTCAAASRPWARIVAIAFTCSPAVRSEPQGVNAPDVPGTPNHEATPALVSSDHAAQDLATTTAPTSAPTRRGVYVGIEASLGLGTAVGLAGIELDVHPVDRIAVHAGGGWGVNGPQVAAGVRYRFKAFGAGDRQRFSLGAAWSYGNVSSQEGYYATYFQGAHMANIDLGYEKILSPSGAQVLAGYRFFVGAGAPFAARAIALSTFPIVSDREPVRVLLLPSIGFAFTFGKGF
ncbi:MAG: hypothetical protein KBF88_06970 [Polyangiaceae bacterium]|nr:hypothetical protein [Polyangiaceae bacterium]